jgi:hypothetical protein
VGFIVAQNDTRGSKSILVDVGDLGELYDGGMEIKHAHRGEDQIELQPETDDI